MANPTLVFDNSAGATDGQASGCGPSTAVYGSNGRVVTGLATHVVFSNASELATGVTADHVLYLGTGSTNRRFSKITTVRTDYVTTACSWTAGDTAVTVASTTGLNVGDVVLINGSYYVIASILTSTTLTCTGLDQGSSYSGTLYRYSQVIVEDSMTVGSGYAWAIGGKLPGMTYGTHTESLRVFADGKAGWTIDVLYGTGTYAAGAAAITLAGSGDSTGGPIKLTSSSTTRPTITSTVSSPTYAIYVSGNYWQISNLNLTYAGAGSSIAGIRLPCSYGQHLISNCTISGFQVGVLVSASFVYATLRHCTIKDASLYCVSAGVNAGSTIDAAGCLFYSTASPTSSTYKGVYVGAQGNTLILRGNVFYNLGSAVVSTASSTTADNWFIHNNTFHTMAGSALVTSAAAGYARLCIENNIFYGITGYGINLSNASLAGNDMCSHGVCNNAYASCSSGLADYITATGSILLSGDPCVNAASLDFRLDATTSEGAACRGVGYPSAVPYSTTRNDFGDIGALQRSFPTLPTAAQVQTGVAFGDDGTQYTGTYAGGQMQAYPLVVAGPQYVG